MDTITESNLNIAATFLRESDFPYFSISYKKGAEFSASCYWPNGDLIRDIHCCGHGETLDAAMTIMREKIEAAKIARRKLRTASECKAEVLKLISEHDAAPASFRDAVDNMDVA